MEIVSTCGGCGGTDLDGILDGDMVILFGGPGGTKLGSLSVGIDVDTTPGSEVGSHL